MSENKDEVKVGVGQKIVYGTIWAVVMLAFYLGVVNKSLMMLQNLAYPY